MGGHQVDKSWAGDILREFASYSFVFAPTFLIFVIESVWSLKASYFCLVMNGVSDMGCGLRRHGKPFGNFLSKYRRMLLRRRISGILRRGAVSPWSSI